MWSHRGNPKKFSDYQKRCLADIHEKQKRDLSNHVVDEEKLRKLVEEEKYILEEQKAILRLYKDIGARQELVNKKIKKLRTKNEIKKYAGDMIENLVMWDGKSVVAATDSPATKELQLQAIAIVEANWKTKLAIDDAVQELFQLEKKLVTIEAERTFKNLMASPASAGPAQPEVEVDE